MFVEAIYRSLTSQTACAVAMSVDAMRRGNRMRGRCHTSRGGCGARCRCGRRPGRGAARARARWPRRSSANAARRGRLRPHRNVGRGRHGRLAVAHGDAAEERRRQRAAQRAKGGRSRRPGISIRTTPRVTSAVPSALPAIMRQPLRVQISWQDDRTLKLETDAGQQTTAVLGSHRPAAGAAVVSATATGGADVAGRRRPRSG